MFGYWRLLSVSLFLSAACLNGFSVSAKDANSAAAPVKGEASMETSVGEEHQGQHRDHAGRRGHDFAGRGGVGMSGVGVGGMGGMGVGGIGMAGMGPGKIGIELAEILMIPSLTKDQQNRIRTLYISFRRQQQKDMTAIQANLASQSSSTIQSGQSGQPSRGLHGELNEVAYAKLQKRMAKQQRNNSSATIGGEILAGLVDQTKDVPARSAEIGSGKGDAVIAGMSGVPGGPGMNGKFQLNKFQYTMKFNADVLSVLTKDQRRELRDIGLKVGSPDYFALRDAGLKAFEQQRMDSRAR